MYVKDVDSFVTLQLLEDTPPVHVAWRALPKIMGTPVSGLWVINHTLSKMAGRYHAIPRNYVPIVVPGLSSGSFQFQHDNFASYLSITGTVARQFCAEDKK